MSRKDYLYRVFHYLRHRLSARNSGGGGIHSPYLFEWVRMIMRDKNSYYVWRDIECIREQMLQNNSELEYIDWGAGAHVKGEKSVRRVCDLAASSLEPAKYGQLLFRLVNWLGHEKRRLYGKGLNIIELGTSLGITTAYLASADSRDNVTTFEGCPAVVAQAQENWKALGLRNIHCVEGNIDDTIFTYARTCEKMDVAFIDANHTYDATCRYFEALVGNMHAKSVLVVDDIYYNSEMHRAWQWICQRPEVTSTMDLYKMGLVFFDPCYWRRNYTLNVYK